MTDKIEITKYRVGSRGMHRGVKIHIPRAWMLMNNIRANDRIVVEQTTDNSKIIISKFTTTPAQKTEPEKKEKEADGTEKTTT